MKLKYVLPVAVALLLPAAADAQFGVQATSSASTAACQGNTGSFLDAAIPSGSSISTTSGSFTFLPLTTKNSDVGNNYSTSTGLYTVPITGIYEITTKLRLADNTTAGISYGQGVDVSAGDGAWFQWFITQATPATGQSYARQGSINSRTVSFTKGQQIGMYYYYSYSAGGIQIASAEMTISYLCSSS